MKLTLALAVLVCTAGIARADAIVLECDLPAVPASSYSMLWPAWHGQLMMDQTWERDDYAYWRSRAGSGRTEISRITAVITQVDEHGKRRSGTCQAVLPFLRKF